MLKHKKILLAVCGSISFYKAFEILSNLKKLGADVYIALSDGALDFVSYESFEALSGHKVLCSKTKNWNDGISHIEYSKVDLVILAPASTNTINKLANGICDNIFMQTLITSTAPIVIAPSANERMLEHFTTKKSLNTLREAGAIIIPPVVKMLACGDVGRGALADVKEILCGVYKALFSDDFYKNKTVMVTAGPTLEKLDDVRAITNLSSGKMGKALADAFYILGANVIFISSVNYEVPYKIIKFETTIGLEAAMQSQKLKEGDIIIMAAAVSDYIPIRVRGKIKKEEFEDVFSFKFKKNKDVISSIHFEGVKKIAFKLEADKSSAMEHAKNMLKSKELDAVCLNILDETVKFGSDDTIITFISRNLEKHLKKDTKVSTAFEIAKLVKSV